jgi:hypothetical protein
MPLKIFLTRSLPLGGVFSIATNLSKLQFLEEVYAVSDHVRGSALQLKQVEDPLVDFLFQNGKFGTSQPSDTPKKARRRPQNPPESALPHPSSTLASG